ncbi:MAG: hypothetical protein RJQ07_13095 [Pseudomonadales bacterium]
MNNQQDVDSAMAQAALLNLPPSLRSTLIEDADFCERFAIQTESTISFGLLDVAFKTSSFYAEIRRLLADGADGAAEDTSGETWSTELIEHNSLLYKIRLKRQKTRIDLPPWFLFLSGQKEVRLNVFSRCLADHFLSSSKTQLWKAILEERELTDDEFGEFDRFIKTSAESQALIIGAGIEKGSTSIASLVPRSRTYYETLVGTFSGSSTRDLYSENEAKAHIDELLGWNAEKGLFQALLMSTHTSLIGQIDLSKIDEDVVHRVFQQVCDSADPWSRLGAIDLGIKWLGKIPSLEDSITSLLEIVRAEDPDIEGNFYELASALMILVDSELSRLRMFHAEPPYYRRLAAIAHASVMQRVIAKHSVKTNEFSAWAKDYGLHQFVLQTLTDLRQEPRWNPNLATPQQLNQEFAGRIILAVSNNKEAIGGTQLEDTIKSDPTKGLSSAAKSSLPFLPGPLEGTQDELTPPPKEIEYAINEQLTQPVVDIKSFVALVNSILIFSIDDAVVRQASQAIRAASHRLDAPDKDSLNTVLLGLASVASVTRNFELASDLKLIVRRHRRDIPRPLTLEEELFIAVCAAACFFDKGEWSEFLGSWITEIAFSEVTSDEARTLRAWIRGLCHISPELWGTSAKGEAALASIE